MARELSSVCNSLVVALEKKKESHALLGMQCACTLMTMTNKARNKELYSDLQSLYLVLATKSLKQNREENSIDLQNLVVNRTRGRE
jgi:hypothetical protein